MVKGGSTYRIVSDHLGSPRVVVETVTGTVAQEFAYDAWGNPAITGPADFQPFGFAGGLYDDETGLVRFGARDYDPEVGRWTGKDPVRFDGYDTNLYGYGWSEPVNVVDPAGLWGFYVGPGVAGTVPGFAGSISSQVVAGTTNGGFTGKVGVNTTVNASPLAMGLAVGRFASAGFFTGGLEGFLNSTAINIDTPLGGVSFLLDCRDNLIGFGVAGPSIYGGISATGAGVPGFSFPIPGLTGFLSLNPSWPLGVAGTPSSVPPPPL